MPDLNESSERILGLVAELEQRDREVARKTLGDLPLGNERLADTDFIVWFTQQAADPYYVLARALDDGPNGARNIARYRRLTHIDPLTAPFAPNTVGALDMLSPEDAEKVMEWRPP